ncbi:hypothetical protein [Luteimonas sp. A478]
MSRQPREEPTLGAIDLSEVEFRRPLPRHRLPESEHRGWDLWWQIALGVFLGMLAHSIVTGLYARWELYQGLKQFGAAIEQVGQEPRGNPDADQIRRRERPATRAPSRPEIRPLAAGERCIGGKRFRRVENGWVQVMEACR